VKEQLQSYTDEEFDEEDEDDTLEDRYLIFSIEERQYGIEIKHITEIVGLHAITEVPDMPAFIKGVINLRGKIIPLLDVRSRFKLSEIEYNDKTCVVILNINNHLIGLIVDTVREVLKIGSEQMEEPPRFGDGNGNRFVKSLAKVKEEVKVLLDVERLFIEDEIKQTELVIQEVK
jgi:purine-binding chemotaxis protein CheW